MKLISLKTEEIKNKISVGLNDAMLKDEFVYRKSDNSFIRKGKENLYIFNMDLLSWGEHYTLDINLYISQKKIESIYERIVGKSDNKITIGNNIGRIYTSIDGRQVLANSYGNLTIRLRQNEDIDAAIESLTWYYKDIAWPYFSKYQELKDIDNILNNPPFDHLPAHAQINIDKRCMKGLIVARLVNNPNYEKLVAIYDEEIKATNETSIENYHKVKEYLMHVSIK